MAKRSKDTITLGSGKLYMKLLGDSDTLPAASNLATFCVAENLYGYIKGGASLEYTQETYEEKDDLGLVSKIITTNEEALLKCGVLTWNGESLKNLVDRCKTTTDGNNRVTKIGGAGNTQGGYYAIVFAHEDKIDGNLWIIIKGRNTAGLTITFSSDTGTVLEPEFKALPSDTDGTLIQLVEEIGTTTGGGTGGGTGDT